MNFKKIAVLGANPAWQKTLFFEDFCCGRVNRAKSIDEFASGKGVNFCRACKIHGKAEPVLLQFSGGPNGRRLTDALSDIGINHLPTLTETPTRCCTTILDSCSGSMTECIEPSFSVSDSEVQNLLKNAALLIPQCHAAAVCGTLPGGTDYKVYTEFAAIAAKHNIPVLLDVCKGIEEILEQPRGILDIKINKDELFQFTGKEDVIIALQILFKNSPALRCAAITDGPGKAFASDGKSVVSYTLPEGEKIVSPLGCGDTASAVFASELACGTVYYEAFRLALGAATANSLSHICGNYLPADAERIYHNISMQSVAVKW